MKKKCLLIILIFYGLLACVKEDAGNDTSARMEVEVLFDIKGGFFDAPFPIETRRNTDGTIRLGDFPNPDNIQLIADYLDAAHSVPEGFSCNGIIYFPFSAPLDEACFPHTTDPVENGPVFFINIDPLSSNRGKRFPILIKYVIGRGKYTPDSLLSVLPYPGFVQEPNTLYAAVILREACDTESHYLIRPNVITDLFDGIAPEGGEALPAGFSALRDVLKEEGIDISDVAGATVYRTGDPTTGMIALQRHASTQPTPEYSITERIRDYATYCVLEGRTKVPIYQIGERPYNESGSGRILFEKGEPRIQWYEDIRFSLSIPKQEMPKEGFPLLFYANGQGGKYTQVVDRGTFAEQESDPENGRGPAYYLAEVGIASLNIEAATVGPRHPKNSYAGLDFFNPFNLDAFRDNIRQAAAEFTILPRVAGEIEIKIDNYCHDVYSPTGIVGFDKDKFIFYGHSTGASIGALVLGVEPVYKIGMLSGAGGSWIYNLAIKEEPIKIREFISTFLILPPGEILDEFHPLTLIFQMAIEAAEAMNFARLWIDKPLEAHDPKNVLLIEGIIDGYFLPRMVNALAMAARLDLAGSIMDNDTPVDLDMVGGITTELPAGPNRGSKSAYLIQFEAVGFDGHYVPFNLPTPKYMYKCWLKSLLETGEAILPLAVDDGEATCPNF